MAAPALGYEDGLKHAHDFLQGITKDNPFAGKIEFSDLATASRATPLVPVPVAPRSSVSAPAVQATAPVQPPLVSQAPLYPRPAATNPATPTAKPNLDPFTNGFFKTAAQRRGGGAGTLPRVSAQSPAVGATRAVPPAPIDAIANAGAGLQRVAPYQVPGSLGSTSYDSSQGTRRPFIAGADGKNVAGDFVDRTGADKSLDRNYVAGLPRTAPPNAPSLEKFVAAHPGADESDYSDYVGSLPRTPAPSKTAVGQTRAVAPPVQPNLSSVPTSGPNTESPSARTVPDFEEPGTRPIGLPRVRNQRAANTTRPRIFGG